MPDRPEQALVLGLDVFQDDDGSFVAHVREWPGCIASGHTFEELVDNVRETVAEYAVAMGLPRPEHVDTDDVPPPLADVVLLRRPAVEVRPEAMSNEHMKVLVREA
ncbi:MAG TPA: type II toxin-antitoxin system HicB family antitoxin [Mycobacteriales bacterium]|jgi:predicted RNase H-like HicB family nuclease|nr:type II toxin-antitoxin system HicB family antitoxin [Mycobacteriales bacterium]